MEKGTKFKLECEVAWNGTIMADGYILFRSGDGEYFRPHKDSVSDIRPPKKPREKVTLPNGRVLYRLREGEVVGHNDYCMGAHAPQISRTKYAGTVVGSTTDIYLSESDGTEDE